MTQRPPDRPGPPAPGCAPPVAEMRVLTLPGDLWGFEQTAIECELRNLALPELAAPAPGDPGYVGTIDLHHPDGRPAARLETQRINGPLAIGASVRTTVRPWIRVFEGEFDLRFALHRRRVGPAGEERLDPLPILERPLRVRVLGGIREAFIELTNACNFRCTFCPQVDLKRKLEVMDLDLAVKVVRELAAMGHHEPIRLHLMGEPLLYPRFAEFVRATHALGQTLRLATNGSRFQPQRIAMLFETGLDEIVISLNTPERHLFDAQRGTDMTWEEYLGGVRAYLAELVRRGAPPKTWLNILYDGSKAHDPDELARLRRVVNEWIDFVRGLGGRPLPTAEEVIDLEPYGGYQRSATFLKLLPDLELQWTAYHQWGGVKAPEQHFCVFPWRQLAILVDGKATACCVDSEGEIVLGDARVQSVREIWEGEPLARIRRGFLQGRDVEERCARCEVCHEKEEFFPANGGIPVDAAIVRP